MNITGEKNKKKTALNILLGLEDDPDQETTFFFDELQGYEASIIPSRDTNPLVWWKSNYPNLVATSFHFLMFLMLMIFV